MLQRNPGILPAAVIPLKHRPPSLAPHSDGSLPCHLGGGTHTLLLFFCVSAASKLQGWSACLNHTVTMAMKPLCGSRVSAGPRVGNDDAGLINRTFRPHCTFEISPVRVEMRPFSPVNPLGLNSQVAESLKDTIQTAGSAVHPSTRRVSLVSPFKKPTYRIRSSSSFLDGARSRGRGGCS